ncbi:MAG: radical SAM protein [Nanoarchaeota archaeon]|nr:radical SAM protein [Nanoarchaeota archaeon]
MLYKDVLKNSLSGRYFNKVLSNGWYAFKSGNKASLPFKLQIENCNVCNLKCEMCAINYMKRKKGFLSFEKFKYAFDSVKPCYLNLTGIGEPLLNKDIFNMVKYAKNRKSFVKMDSNAVLLDKETIKNLLNSKIDIISISIDSVKKEIYETIRKGANFNKVLNNIKNLVEIRNKSGAKTQIHLFSVFQKENINEVEDIIQLGNNLGVDSINGTFIHKLGDNENKVRSLKTCDIKVIKDILKKKEKIIKNSKANIRMESLFEDIKILLKNKKYDLKAPCYMPWYSPFVTWDGFVSPCCFFADKEIVFGNLFEEPFIKIWNSKKAIEFRKQLVKERVGICKGCGIEEHFLYNKFKFFHKVPILKELSSRTHNQ